MLLKNQTRRQTTRTALIFSLLALLIVSIGCKKETKIPTPADANALIGTTWKENTNEKVETQKFKITFLTDTTFDCSQLKDKESVPIIRTRTWSDGIARNDTLGVEKTKYFFDYKDGKGNIICKYSNYNANWVGSVDGLIHRVTFDTQEGTIATFTISNNVLNLIYIDTTTARIINGANYLALNEHRGLRPLRDPVTIVKQ